MTSYKTTQKSDRPPSWKTVVLRTLVLLSEAVICRTRPLVYFQRTMLFDLYIIDSLRNERHELDHSKTYSLVNIRDKQIVTRENEDMWETRTGNFHRKHSAITSRLPQATRCVRPMSLRAPAFQKWRVDFQRIIT